MSKDGFTLRYLAHTAAGVPRDLANTLIVSKLKPIRPTVLIYNCTWVCDARCTMCSNWKWGDRKSDMTLEQLEPVMNNPFWGAVENLNIYPSGNHLVFQGYKKGRTNYKITVDGSLLDTFGQKLGSTATATIRVGSADATLYAQGGFMTILDPSAKQSFSIYSIKYKCRSV